MELPSIHNPAGPIEGDVDDARKPDLFGVAVGDLVAGQPERGPVETVIGAVERIIAPDSAGYTGNHYEVRVADLFPTGDVQRRRLAPGVTIIAPADKPVGCRCGQTHGSPGRFVDCLIAHVRAVREAEAVRAASAGAVRA